MRSWRTPSGAPPGWRRSAALILLAAAGCLAPPAADRPPRPSGDERAAAAARPAAEATVPGTRLAVQVLGVERAAPAVLVVRFALVNRDPAVAAVVRDRLAGSGQGDQGSLAGVYLIDERGAGKYFVMRDAADRPQCTTGLQEVPAGGRVEAWGRFPGPPAGASTIAVQVPGLAPFRGLPITEPEGGARRTDEPR